MIKRHKKITRVIAVATDTRFICYKKSSLSKFEPLEVFGRNQMPVIPIETSLNVRFPDLSKPTFSTVLFTGLNFGLTKIT